MFSRVTRFKNLKSYYKIIKCSSTSGGSEVHLRGRTGKFLNEIEMFKIPT